MYFTFLISFSVAASLQDMFTTDFKEIAAVIARNQNTFTFVLLFYFIHHGIIK